jgi:hypothetical protein
MGVERHRAGNYVVMDGWSAAALVSVSPPPRLVSLWWRQLRDAQFRLPRGFHGDAFGALMHLSEGAVILGNVTMGSDMYIRPHWDALYQRIKTQLENATRKGILLVGTPGIGQNSGRAIQVDAAAACACPCR